MALRFIAGRYAGGEFPLEAERELLIGRDVALELQLDEQGVSRHHAKVKTQGSILEIRDLNSTNGTFVNGEKITRIALVVGDRILIGRSLIQVVTDP